MATAKTTVPTVPLSKVAAELAEKTGMTKKDATGALDEFVGLIVKDAVVAPAATVTLADTGAIVTFELLRVTTVPEGPAGPDSVTVPVTVFELLP